VAPDRLEIDCSLGLAFKGLGRPGLAIELLEATAARALEAGQRTIELRARVEMMFPLLARGALTTDEAAALLDEALIVFRQADDVLGIARAETTYASILEYERRSDGALAHVERAAAAYRSLGRRGQVDIIAVLCALSGTTTVPRATDLCEGSLARNADNPRAQAYLLVYLGVLKALSGDTLRAREASAAGRSHLEDLGEDVGLGTSAAAMLGETEAIAGDWARAREIYEQGLRYARDRPEHRDWHGYFLARLGETAVERGDPETAASLAEEARGLATETDAATRIWWRRVASRALSATGQARKAVRLGREAISVADTTDDVLHRSGARLDLAEVQLRAGRRTEARSLVCEALDLLDRKEAVLPAAGARERFAGLLAGEGAASAAPSDRGS